MERRSFRDDKTREVVRYAGASGASGYSGYGAPNKLHYEPIYYNGKKFVHSDKYRTYVHWEKVGGGRVVGTTLEQEIAAVAKSQEEVSRAIAERSPFSQTAKLADEGKLFQVPEGLYSAKPPILDLDDEDEDEEEDEEEDEVDDRFDPDRPLIKPGEAGFDKVYQEYYDAHVGRDEAIQNAYGSNRVWTSPDAVITEVTKDGVTTTNVAPRVMFDDRQKMSLFLNGFAWNDLDYCFKKNGALTDQNYADFVDDHIIDGAKNQRDGRNPENIDQFVYRFVRRTKTLEHLPPQFHHGIPLRTNVQHSRDKKERSATDWPVSWITYEEDGYTYCEIPYRTPADLKEAFDREKFKYDGVAKRWYYPGMLDEAMEQRLATLNVRYPGEPVSVEGEHPVVAEETAPEEPTVPDEPAISEVPETPSAIDEYKSALAQVKDGANSFDEWSERLENSGLSYDDKAKAYEYATKILGFSNNVNEDEYQVLQYLNHYLNDLIGETDKSNASEPDLEIKPDEPVGEDHGMDTSSEFAIDEESQSETDTSDNRGKRGDDGYYPTDETLAKAAQEANSFRKYVPGSTTREYRTAVDAARKVAARQKERVDERFHPEIDRILDSYERQLASWYDRYHTNAASCPSIMVSRNPNFSREKHDEKIRRTSELLREHGNITELIGTLQNVGLGGFGPEDVSAREREQDSIVGPPDNKLEDVFEYGGYGATSDNYHELMEMTANVDTLQTYGNERWGKPFSSDDIDVVNQAKAVIDDPNILPELRGRILKHAHEFVFGWDTLSHPLRSDLLRNCLKATDNSLPYMEARRAVWDAQWHWYITPKALFTSKTREEAIKWVYPYKTCSFFDARQNAEVRKREKQLLSLAGNPAVSNVEALYIVDEVGAINDHTRKALASYKANPGYYDQSGFSGQEWEKTTKLLDELEAKVSLLRERVSQSTL